MSQCAGYTRDSLRTASRATTALFALILLAVSVLALPGSAAGRDRSADSASQIVAIDLRAPRQVMQGFGMSLRVWDDPHVSNAPRTVIPASAQRAILVDLYRRLGLTRVRPVLDPGIQPIPEPKFNFTGKLGESLVAFVKQAKPYGLRTFFPGPVYLEDWMTPNSPGAYVDYAMAVLRYWRSQGHEPPLYAPLNEPEIARDFPAQWMRQVVVQLGRRLKADGFKTKLVIPDDENPVSAYERATAVLADPEARKYVAALAYHIYNGEPSDWVRIRELGARHKLPVWMTEYTTKEYGTWPDALRWATVIHTLIATGGVSAVDYLWGFFGEWVGAETMISIRFDDGVYRSHSFTPVYWLTGQYSRFVRPGYRRVAATTPAGPVLTTAFKGPGRLVVVAINQGGSAQRVRLVVRGGRIRGPISTVRTSSSETWRSLPALPVTRSTFVATLPPHTVTTLVARR